MKVIVLGSDGYIGSEYAQYSDNDLILVDNFYKRMLLKNLNIRPLYSNLPTGDHYVSVNNWQSISELIRKEKPDAIIHLAENPSAPYSMRGREEAEVLAEPMVFIMPERFGKLKNIPDEICI